jgi:class 3 adenylate cyclase/pimeloyl-ACP methyl ester carboxylesterase
MPVTQYARSSDGSQIAYQVVGDGDVDVLVAAPNFVPVDLLWDEPRAVQFLQRLSSFSRHIWFDFRGTGASDGIAASDERLLENWVEDMVAVVDAAGCERVAVLQLWGVGVGPLFAATYPGRTSALVLVDTTARALRADDYPEGYAENELEALTARGGELFSAEFMAPNLANDRDFHRWYDRAVRLGAPPDVRRRRLWAAMHTDVRAALGSVQAPTLVISRRGSAPNAQRQYLADHIPGARYAAVEGLGQLPFLDSGPVLDATEEFLTGHSSLAEPDRVLATVLFTDLVASTRQASEMGDRRWRNLLATHDALVQAQLDRFHGRQVKSTGDGILATFDGPGRAIRCACAIRDALGALGLEVRAGLHTGEIELRGDDITGIAVVIGQRISAQAGPGDVFVSRTVADLITGSDIELRPEGDYELKGLDGTWPVYRVTRA